MAFASIVPYVKNSLARNDAGDKDNLPIAHIQCESRNKLESQDIEIRTQVQSCTSGYSGLHVRAVK